MSQAINLAQLAEQIAQLAAAVAEQARMPDPPTPIRPLPQRTLLTVEEASEYLGIGRTTAFKLIDSGELQSVTIGRLRRIPVSAADEYAASLIERQCKSA
ncbi:helix-turn-helix domain-containing protein [Amycolatopsis sp. NPDC102389]|uniref:helix-turn-helix domain-containing protein n=1 Tax=Amycolatopsis sp. NPDC102389 TaxID=3363941 RepID=UPI0037FF477D